MTRLVRWIAVVVVLVSQLAVADVMGGGTLRWARDLNFVSSTQARFVIEAELSGRRSATYSVGTNPSVGQTLATDFSITVGANTSAIPMQVVASNTAEDLIVLTGSLTVTVNLTALPANVVLQGCCRLARLLEGNAGQGYALRTVLPASSALSRSPRSTVSPIVFLSQNQPASFQFPATAPGGTTVSFSTAATSASGLSRAIPVGASLSSFGVFMWTPTTLGTYAMQVTLTASDGTVAPADVLLKVVPPPPPPPAFTSGCGNNAPPLAFTLGREVTFDVIAASQTPGDTVVITSTPAPEGGTVVPVTVGTTSTSRFTWTKPRDTTGSTGGAVMCFLAEGVGGQSLGSCCRSLTPTPTLLGSYTGAFRDFAIVHPDFAISDQGGVGIIEATLSASRKPVARLPVRGSLTSESAFNGWWTDTSSGGQQGKTTALTLTLSSGASTDPDVLTFSSTQFYPRGYADGFADGPLPNRNFTWELHDAMPYVPGTQLGFAAADDLWVFVNGRLLVDLGGVHARQSTVIDLDTWAPLLGLVSGQTYPVDLFFAHRGNHDPAITFQLLARPRCTAPALAWSPDAGAIFFGQAGFTADGGLGLLRPGNTGAGAAFLPEPVSVSDFEVSFEPRAAIPLGDAGFEGFAMLLAPAPAVGANAEDAGATRLVSDGSGLGFDGVPSIAIEFDARANGALGDPNAQHVAVLTRGPAGNTVNHVTAERGALWSDQRGKLWPNPRSVAPLALSFTANNPMRARVRWTRIPTQPTGWLRVSFEPVGGAFLHDDLEVEFDAAEFDALFPSGRAYVGFTASHSFEATRPASTMPFQYPSPTHDVRITKVSVGSAHPTLSSSVHTAPASTAPYGQPVAMRLQAIDECGQRMPRGGFGSHLVGTAQNGAGTTTPVMVTDRGDGTYDLMYLPSTIGGWQLTLALSGLPISGALPIGPFTTQVTAVCGDGVQHGAEACDDDNVIDGDGCSSTCTVKVIDAGAPDAGALDSGVADAGGTDAGAPDAGLPDAGGPDAGALDSGVADAGAADAGLEDAGLADAGGIDAGLEDAGIIDAGVIATGGGGGATGGGGGATGGGGGATGGGGGGDAMPSGCGCGAGGFDAAFLLLGALLMRRKRVSREG